MGAEPSSATKPKAGGSSFLKGLSVKSEAKQAGAAKSAPAKQKSQAKGQPLVLTRIGLGSFFRICLVFYTLFFLVMMVAGVVSWQFLSSAGYVRKLNHLIDSLIGSATYHVVGSQVLLIAAGFGIVGVIFFSAVSTILAKLFNLVSDLLGGVTIYLRQGGSSSR